MYVYACATFSLRVLRVRLENLVVLIAKHCLYINFSLGVFEKGGKPKMDIQYMQLKHLMSMEVLNYWKILSKTEVL